MRNLDEDKALADKWRNRFRRNLKSAPAVRPKEEDLQAEDIAGNLLSPAELKQAQEMSDSLEKELDSLGRDHDEYTDLSTKKDAASRRKKIERILDKIFIFLPR